jgi:hypothetical protein
MRGRYSFIVMDLQHLLLAGLPAHSALPLIADLRRKKRYVRNVPKSDIDSITIRPLRWQGS